MPNFPYCQMKTDKLSLVANTAKRIRISSISSVLDWLIGEIEIESDKNNKTIFYFSDSSVPNTIKSIGRQLCAGDCYNARINPNIATLYGVMTTDGTISLTVFAR